MLLLIIKSSACLATFMIFYKLFLEKESMHSFKRFYLLGALLVSIVIPFITFTQYIETVPVPDLVPFQVVEITEGGGLETTWQNYIPTILWLLYTIGVMAFSFRFARNLKNIISKIKTNPKHKFLSYTNVLLQDIIPPHTFFKYIFVNKSEYECDLIPKEVLLHEQTHAKQKHALDIIIIELLQIAFWFNPLIYLIKKDIKLNHEFLADQAVINNGINVSQYKETLLAFSSNAKDPELANAINYSSIKKRFTVMKSKTSKHAIWFRSLILLPILAILIYGFSEKVEVAKENPKNNISPEYNQETPITIEIKKKGQLIVNHEKCHIKDLGDKLDNLTKNISKEEKKKIIVNLTTSIDNPETYVSFTKEFIRLSGFTKISLNNTSETQVIRQKYEGPKFYRIIFYLNNDDLIAVHGTWTKLKDLKNVISHYHQTKNRSLTGIELTIRNGTSEDVISKTKSILSEFGEVKIKFTENKPWGGIKPQGQKATPKEMAEYNSLVKAIMSQPENQRIFKQKDVIRIKYIYGLMSVEQKEKYAEPFPKFPTPPPIQEIATKEQIAEYNKLAKNISSQPEGQQIIKVKDLKRLKHLYNLMSAQQKKNAEPFPKIAPMPSPVPASIKVKEVPAPSKKTIKRTLNDGELIEIREVPPPPIPKNATQEQKKKYQKVISNFKKKKYNKQTKELYIEVGEIPEIIEVPPPPAKSESIKIKEKPKLSTSKKSQKIKVKEVPPPPPPSKKKQ